MPPTILIALIFRAVMGLYIILADDYVDGFDTAADWQPELYEYQKEAANVLYFTFINPDSMVVPKAFERLAATRGTQMQGAVPNDTRKQNPKKYTGMVGK